MSRLDNVRIRQLDSALSAFAELRDLEPPASGWINVVREALGMSIRQLARRAGMSKTGVASAEKLEAKGSVQMDTLRRLAEALGCDLVYAIVPRESLEQSLSGQAKSKARKLVNRVSDSMELEEQGIPSAERLRQIEEIAEDLLRKRGRDFWDD